MARLRHSMWLFHLHGTVKIRPFSPFSPWLNPCSGYFIGYSFGISRNKASTLFYDTALTKEEKFRCALFSLRVRGNTNSIFAQLVPVTVFPAGARECPQLRRRGLVEKGFPCGSGEYCHILLNIFICYILIRRHAGGGIECCRICDAAGFPVGERGAVRGVRQA